MKPIFCLMIGALTLLKIDHSFHAEHLFRRRRLRLPTCLQRARSSSRTQIPPKSLNIRSPKWPKSGGKIELAPGEYLLDRTLTIPARTTLSGQGKSTRLIFESSDPVEAGLLVSKADDVTLRDLALVSSWRF
jgi:hypothetical protein